MIARRTADPALVDALMDSLAQPSPPATDGRSRSRRARGRQNRPARRARNLARISRPGTADDMLTLQGLDDAIAYRCARLDTPCGACTRHRTCAQHALDAALTEMYMDKYADTWCRMFAGKNLDHIADLIGSYALTPTKARIATATLATFRDRTAREQAPPARSPH